MTVSHGVAPEKAGSSVGAGSCMPFSDEFLHQLLRIHVPSGSCGFGPGPSAGSVNHRSIGPIRVALDGGFGPSCIGHLMSLDRGRAAGQLSRRRLYALRE